MKRVTAITCAALVAAGAAVAPVAGQGAAVTAGVVGQGIAAAIEAHGQALRTRLRSALAAFDASLSAQAAGTREGWHSYLRWDSWAEQALVSEAWDQPAMKRNAKRLYAAEQGFEHPLVIALRIALTEYLHFEEAVAEAGGDLEGYYRRHNADLERALASGSADYAELEAAAWWLAAVGQTPPALAQARARYKGSVIVGQIGRDVVEAKLKAFENSASEVRHTSNTIQGARVTGTAHVNSRAWAELVNGPNDARIRVTTSGEVLAPHNTSRSGSVRVSSSSRSQFTAVADVYWNGQTFLMSTPRASADMQSRIKGIDAPWFGRRIAARRVYGSRASAQRQGEALIEQQAAEAMSARLAVAVDKLNAKSQGLLNLMARTGNSAQRWSTRVLATAVEIGYLPPTLAGIGSLPRNVPPLVGDERIGLSFHDAGVEGILSAQVAGTEWADVNFATLQRELTGGNHEEMLIGLDGSRWSAEWTWRLPVRIQFTPAGATVRYRFARVEIDGEACDIPLEVRADLRVVPTPLGLDAQVREPVTVAALDPARPLPTHVQAFLERKFRGLFGEHFYLDGFQFPAGGHLDPLSSYRLVAAHVEPGWIHLRYTNKPPHTEVVSQETAAQAGR
jgi:hypothetical protein